MVQLVYFVCCFWFAKELFPCAEKCFSAEVYFSRTILGCLELGVQGGFGLRFGHLFPTTSSREKGLGGFLFMEFLEMVRFSVWVWSWEVTEPKEELCAGNAWFSLLRDWSRLKSTWTLTASWLMLMLGVSENVRTNNFILSLQLSQSKSAVISGCCLLREISQRGTTCGSFAVQLKMKA